LEYKIDCNKGNKHKNLFTKSYQDEMKIRPILESWQHCR